MKIIVCIKQIPDTSDIKWTVNNTINRDGVESVLNPLDYYAIETALKFKDSIENVEVIAVTMGPLQADNVLKKAISMGCDKAFLLSDKNFAGSDTYATAKTLSQFIKNFVPDFDFIVCGQFAADGDTAQTGPSLARQLDVSVLTYVKDVNIEADKIYVEKETDFSIEKYSVSAPLVLCVLQSDNEPRRPKINGFIKAKNAKIQILNCADLKIKPEETGLKGSPTYVSKAFTPKITHLGEIYENKNIEDTVDKLILKIKEYE